MAEVLKLILIGSDPLTRFLNAAAARPFVWGQFDCLTWLADFILEQRGVDPAADLRQTYSTMLGAAKVVKHSGGMVPLVGWQLAPFGIERVSIVERGDIAVVAIAGDGGEHFGNQAGAILLGGTAACLCQDGLAFRSLADAPPVAAWRI